MKKSRKGFSLVEMIAVAICLAIITISTALVSQSVSSMKVQASNSVYLTTHNLNVMESLRAYMNTLGGIGELPSFYDKDVFSDGNIETYVYIEPVDWDGFHVYKVRIESRVIGYVQKLTNTYILTDIGVVYDPVIMGGLLGGDTDPGLPSVTPEVE